MNLKCKNCGKLATHMIYDDTFKLVPCCDSKICERKMEIVTVWLDNDGHTICIEHYDGEITKEQL